MEAVIFDGKEYVKASVVAERFKYTQDYIGQLCRGKKVDARLVGRAWYINLESLHSHKKARYKGSESKSETNNSHVQERYLSRIDVEPVLKKKTVKILRNTGNKLSEFPVIYENDDFSLIPHVNRNSIAKTLAIVPAEAEDLSVATTKESHRVTNFAAEPLPEVYLKGVLRVDGLPEAHEEEINEINKDRSQLETDSPGIQEKNQPPVKSIPDRIIANESKKPIKIKLYRGDSKIPLGFSQPKHNADFRKPQSSSAVNSVVQKPINRPVRQLLPLRETNLEPKNLIKSHTLTPITPNKSKNEILIPHATFKALSIFSFLTIVAIGLLLPKESLVVADGSVVKKWDISFEKIQGMLSLLNTK